MGLRFTVEPAHVDEWEDQDADPAALVAHNADIKAEALTNRHPSALILAADTTVALDDHVLNKPADLTEARSMLKRLRGRTHVVHTAVALRLGRPGKPFATTFVETSEVTFQPFDDERISAFFKVVDPLDKAGAYGIQEGRELIIERWQGSFSNIMGLPVERLEEVLRKAGLWDDLPRA